jgi:hypothetical protein
MTNTQLAAVLGHAQTHTTERYSAIARSRQQRLGSIAFEAAMGNVAPPVKGSSKIASIRK